MTRIGLGERKGRAEHGDGQGGGQRIGQVRDRKSRAKVVQRQTVVECEPGAMAGWGGQREREGRRIGHGWGILEDRTGQGKDRD